MLDDPFKAVDGARCAPVLPLPEYRERKKERLANMGPSLFVTWVAFGCLIVGSRSLAQPEEARQLDVRDFGALGNGTALDTVAIQKAVDACSSQGGGKVVLSAGSYLCGTLLLKDNVTLHLDKEAVLLGSKSIADYQVVDAFTDGTGSKMGYCFLGAVDARHVGIEGPGTIDGQGKELLAGRTKADGNKRPFLVRFVRCSGVSIDNIRLQHSAAWTAHLFQCSDVKAAGVSILSRGLGNNDGFDVDSCRGVRITNCDVDSGDDALCFKTTSPQACRDVVVEGCNLSSGCGAIKMGTESVGDFDDIHISRCAIHDTNLGGIKLLSVDGAHLQNVSISDITMKNVTTPIFIRLGARLKTFRPGDEKREVGITKNLKISNVTATSTAATGIVISGIPGHSAEGLTLDNIQITLPGKGEPEASGSQVPEKESTYPELGMFGKQLPAYGLYARHVKHLEVSRLKIELAAPDARPLRICDDVDDVRFSD